MSADQFAYEVMRELEEAEYAERIAQQNKGSASTRDAGKQCGERFRAGENDEQKQPGRDEQQPVHPLV